MKMIFALSIPLIIIFASCTKTLYIPVESVRTEYINQHSRDSIFLHDSTTMFVKGDTVFKEKYRYFYKDRLLHDSIYVNDTIRVPYPVVETREVNHVNGFQNFQIWCGRILLLLLGGYLIWRHKK